MKFVPKPLKKTADISRGRVSLSNHVKNVISVIVILGAVYLLVLGISHLLAVRISDETEAKWFGSFIEPPEEKPENFDRAEELFKKLLNYPRLRRLRYQLTVIEMDMANAGAMPGGGVGVTPELLKQVKSDAGLAMVLAHELGHHQYRHCLQRLGHQLLLTALWSVTFGGSDPAVVRGGRLMLDRAYSRKQEYDADEFGLRMIHYVFGRTGGALEFFELVIREYKSGLTRWNAWLSTHPLTQDRIDRLKKLQKTLKDIK